MTIHDFTHLSDEEQLAHVYWQGTFLATRFDEEDAVNLYQLPGGFFAELHYDAHTDQLQVYAFTDAEKLEYYAMFVKLPDWLPEV